MLFLAEIFEKVLSFHVIPIIFGSPDFQLGNRTDEKCLGDKNMPILIYRLNTKIRLTMLFLSGQVLNYIYSRWVPLSLVEHCHSTRADRLLFV